MSAVNKAKANRSKKTTLIISYTLLALWALVIFYLSSEGSNASSGRSDAITQVLASWGAGSGQADSLTFFVRKSAHTIAYFIFGLLAYNVVRHYQQTLLRTTLIAWVIVIVYAASDEFHQLFVPGRSAELRDVLIDSTAGLVGILLWTGARWLVRRRQRISLNNIDQ